MHTELKATPLARYLHSPSVARKCPDSGVLTDAFRIEVQRRARRADGTLSLGGGRFEIPARLRHLSVVHQTTLPYSPYQNAKQESFWGRVEGRLMAMLEGEQALTLELLNEATQAWRIVVNSAGIPPHGAHRAQGHAAGALPAQPLGGAQVP